MAVSIILFSAVVLLLLLNIFMVKWPSIRVYYFTRKLQGLAGLPIIGNLHKLFTTKPEDVLDILKKYMEVYPRLTTFNVSGVKYILFQEPEDVQVLLGNADHIQKGIEYDVLHPWLNEGLLTSTGQKWKARRKILTPIYSCQILKDSLNTINKKSDLLVENLHKSSGKIVRINQCISKCALDIIGEIALGVNLKAQEEDGLPYVHSVQSANEAATVRLLKIWQYKDWLFKLSQNGIIFYKNLQILHNLTSKVVKEKIDSINDDDVFELEEKCESDTKESFLENYLEAQRMNTGLYADTSLDIREEVDTFMFKGHETTSSAISFTLWLLGMYTEHQDIVYKELQDIFSDGDREITMSDISKMNYLEKVIKETLRLYPSVPYISRLLNQDCILDDGTVIPDGVNAVVLPYFLHRNERFFPDPETFDPNRFDEAKSVGRHPFAYIPFSAGPRNCIGQKFALLEIKITLAKILKRFSIKSITKREECKILPYIIIKPTVHLKCIFSPRKK